MSEDDNRVLDGAMMVAEQLAGENQELRDACQHYKRVANEALAIAESLRQACEDDAAMPTQSEMSALLRPLVREEIESYVREQQIDFRQEDGDQNTPPLTPAEGRLFLRQCAARARLGKKDVSPQARLRMLKQARKLGAIPEEDGVPAEGVEQPMSDAKDAGGASAKAPTKKSRDRATRKPRERASKRKRRRST